jgi:hypothetical protein
MDETTTPQSSLRFIGNEISTRFRVLSQTMNTNHLRRFLNEAQRFDIWASNLGVFHDGHSSLDYRFRDSSPLFEYTFNLLYDLSEALSACKLAMRPLKGGDTNPFELRESRPAGCARTPFPGGNC